MASAMLLACSILLVVVGSTSACSPLETDRVWSLVKTLNNAPIIVVATDIYHSHGPDEFNVAPENNTAIFDVDCVLKSGGYNLSRNISIHEGAVRQSAACHVSVTEVGTKYIVGLKKYPHLPEGRFSFYEPNALTSGVYEASEENLKTAATVCGLDNPVTALGVGAVQDLCPVVLVDQDDCETGGASWIAGPVALLIASKIFGGWFLCWNFYDISLPVLYLLIPELLFLGLHCLVYCMPVQF